jgi:hypothetical protein
MTVIFSDIPEKVSAIMYAAPRAADPDRNGARKPAG